MRDGTSVTNTSVHKWLGHGSMSTIDKYTKAWQSENSELENSPSNADAAELPDAIVDAAQMMFQIALDEARRQIKKEFDQRYTAFEAERERLGTELLDALDKVSEAERNVAGLQEARKKYKELLENEQAQSRSLEEKLENSERERAALVEQCAQQEKALSEHMPVLESEQRSPAEDLEIEKAQFEAQLTQLQQRLDEEAARGRELEDNMGVVANDLLIARERVKSKSEQLLESDRALAEVRSQIAGMELTVVELSRNLEQMTDRYEEQTASVDKLSEERTALASQLEARDVEVEHLRTDRDQHEQRANQALADLSEIVRAGLRQKGLTKEG